MALTSLLSRASLSALTTVSEPMVCSPPNEPSFERPGSMGPEAKMTAMASP